MKGEPVKSPKIEIEHGKAIPSKNRYPFERMRIGDSFTVPLATTNIRSLRSAATQYSRIHAMRFTVRTNANAVQVWRIE